MVGVWGAGRALVLRGDTSACGIAASQLRTPRGIAMLCVRRSTHDADPDISILENPILAARFIEFVKFVYRLLAFRLPLYEQSGSVLSLPPNQMPRPESLLSFRRLIVLRIFSLSLVVLSEFGNFL